MTPCNVTVFSLATLIDDFVQPGRQRGIGQWRVSDDTEIQLGMVSGNAIDKCDGSIRCVTANVNTLAQLGRVQILEQKMMEAGADIIGIQESRIQLSNHVDGMYYDMYSAAADQKGDYGVQPWVRKALGVIKCAVQPLTPRCLTAVLALKDGWQLSLVVAHAPIEDDVYEAKGMFWSEVGAATQRLRDRYPKAVLCVLIDANAHVGSVQSCAIGSAGKQTENDNGERFRRYADEARVKAVNTFVEHAAAPTWFGRNQQRGQRIDYTCCDRAAGNAVVGAHVMTEVDLATAVKRDHIAVAMDIDPGRLRAATAGSDNDLGKQRVNAPVKPDAASLTEPWRRAKFQRELARRTSGIAETVHEWRRGTDESSPAHLDERIAAWTEAVQDAAESSFKRPKKKRPRKRWITDEGWQVVKLVAPARRQLCRMNALQARVAARVIVTAWRRATCAGENEADQDGAINESCCRGQLPPRQHSCGISEVEGMHVVHRLNFECTKQFIALRQLQRASRAVVKQDRLHHVEKIAREAQHAADRGDGTSTYRYFRQLTGSDARQLEAVADLQGNVLTDEVEVQARWTQHFRTVFGAQVMENGHEVKRACALECGACSVDCNVHGVSLEEVSQQIHSMAKNKGLGPDGITSELLHAGGATVAGFIHEIANDMFATGWFPLAWRGGRLVRLWKRKGSTLVCDHFRGLLLSDHVSKVITGLLQERIKRAYLDYIPREQFGCAEGRSTAHAVAHTVWFIEANRLAERSMAVLFVDLTKAFDMAVREIMMGWMPAQASGTRAQRVDHLRRLGLDDAAADDMCSYIDESGGILKECGVDDATVRLVRSLHHCSWFKTGDGAWIETEVLVSSRGGRQGCRLGAIVFNLIYAKCLKKVRAELQERGITLMLRATGDAAFWSDDTQVEMRNRRRPGGAHGDGIDDCEELVEATYVDDEAIYLSANSPKALAAAVQETLAVLQQEFARFAFKINWAKGKTEMMLRLRGKNATRTYSELVAMHEGQPVIVLPDGQNIVHVVDSYKHVGTVAAEDGSWVPEAAARSSAAMQSYGPLAMKLFGSQLVAPPVRLALASSLVLSRLLLHAGLWPELGCTARNKIAAAYMRVMRRIHGAVRGKGGWNTPDSVVAAELGVNTIDEKLRIARLSFLEVLVNRCPPALLALLRTRGRDGSPMSWTAAIRRDLADMQRRLPMHTADLGDPITEAERWYNAIRSCPREWHELVLLAYQPRSGPDAVACARVEHAVKIFARRRERSLKPAGGPHGCTVCAATFHTNKAARQHERAKHGFRATADRFVGSDPVCPVCGKRFATRLRAVAHLSEARVRSKTPKVTCRERVLRGEFPPAEAADLLLARRLDRVERSAARRRGHTVPVVGRLRHAMSTAAPPAVAVQRPKRRISAKTDPARVDMVWKRLRLCSA